MDGIQAYSAHAHHPAERPIVASVHTPGHHPVGNASAVKQPSDYFQAVRRRIWLVLLVAIPIASVGTLLVLRLPAVYSVTAMMSIEPPKTDPAIRNLVGSAEMVVSDSGAASTYVPSTLAILNSKSFLQEVLSDKALGLPPSAFDATDPAAEMIGKIKARIMPLSTNVVVTYEGRDPELITRILNHTLKKFEERADKKSRMANNEAEEKASQTFKLYGEELRKIDEDLANLIQESKDLAPNGKNIKEAEFELLRQKFYQQQNEVAATKTKMEMDALHPQTSAADQAKSQKIAALEESLQMPARRLAQARKTARNDNDPAVARASLEVQTIKRQIARLSQSSGENEASIEEAQNQILAQAVDSMNMTQERIGTLMNEMQGSMPHYQKFETLRSNRDLKAKALAEIRSKLDAFRIVTTAQKKPVDIIDMADTPTIPIRPNRAIYIAIAVCMSLAAGLALVCLLEHVDHSVKVPEHLTAGLALPLFGVVPRMIRSSRNHRGGHLWTSGTPDSIEADAYRNLRASLLGATDGKVQIVTLLITSAKAGEGKSTTALNLAATCARAGERTLLMDVDLRRPSLNGVFPAQDHDHGLVDVLRGDLPWQRTVVQTDLPNLDFLPTGDTRDVPIEVLGSLELRQLLLSLSQNHYDRVILDGPAVLGLADCRMLGRIVDAAVMVVRSGSQEIRSLQRAKAMLQQSQVFIAGLIFNGLCDDLENWSSYGPNPVLDTTPAITQVRPGSTRGLGSGDGSRGGAGSPASMLAATSARV